METINYAKIIVNGLKRYCEWWEYDWIDLLMKDRTESKFHSLFCKVTRNYFVTNNKTCYSVHFFKDNTVTIKRCGPDYSKRDVDATLQLSQILKEL